MPHSKPIKGSCDLNGTLHALALSPPQIFAGLRLDVLWRMRITYLPKYTTNRRLIYAIPHCTKKEKEKKKQYGSASLSRLHQLLGNNAPHTERQKRPKKEWPGSSRRKEELF